MSPAANFGFRDTDWQGALLMLRAIHAQTLALRQSLVPYTGGWRNRGDTLHDAVHTLAHRLGAPDDFLRGDCDLRDQESA